MPDRAKIMLDYSSPASEAEPERARKRAVGDYNEATYGERHPYAGPLLRRLIYYAILFVMLQFVPLSHWLRDLLDPVFFTALVIWDYWRYSR